MISQLATQCNGRVLSARIDCRAGNGTNETERERERVTKGEQSEIGGEQERGERERGREKWRGSERERELKENLE